MKNKNEPARKFFQTFPRPVDFAKFNVQLLHSINSVRDNDKCKIEFNNSELLIVANLIEFIQIPWMNDRNSLQVVINGFGKMVDYWQGVDQILLSLASLSMAVMIDVSFLGTDEEEVIKLSQCLYLLHEMFYSFR